MTNTDTYFYSTWNNPFETYQGLSYNVTDISSSNNSVLFNLKRNNINVLTVGPNNSVVVNGNINATSITSSLLGTSSYSVNSNYSITASVANTANISNTSNFATTSSYCVFADMAYLCNTASYVALLNPTTHKMYALFISGSIGNEIITIQSLS